MSDGPAWAEICAPEGTFALVAGDFCGVEVPSPSSPIDDYYEYIGDLMTLGDEARLEASDVLGRLLLLGLVSGVEQYFRSIIAGVLRMCPISREVAADQMIHFGALDHYGVEGVEAALFDASSLADAAEVRKRTHKLIGFQIAERTSTYEALEEFDKVCVMRHAAVHSRGTLGRGNVRDLGIPLADQGSRVLKLEFATLQQAGAACQSVVRAYNRFVFRKTIERWGAEKNLTWEWEADGSAFTDLVGLFASKKDFDRSIRAYDVYRGFRSAFTDHA